MSGSDITYSTYGGNQFPVVATTTEESLDIVSGSTEMYNMTSSSASTVIDSWMSVKYNLASVIVVGLALTLVTAATAVGNLLVGLALVRYQRLRTMSNCLIGNLALSDFLLAVTVLPLSVANEILGHWIFGSLACKTWLIIDVLYCTASIWNLCVIAADRFTATMYPLWYRDRRSTTRAILYIAVVWAVAGATCVPPLIGWTGENYVYDDTTASYQCMPFSDASYVIYSASTSFFVPFLVTCVLYSWIFVVLRRRMRAMRARRKSEAAAAASSTSCGGPSKRISIGLPTFSLGNNGSGATGGRFWTRHWNRLRRKCASIRATTTTAGEGIHNNGSEQQEQEDSSAGKSAYVTEYSDEKSSVADTEADLASMTLDFDSSKSPFSLRSATHFRFTSVRRPFQNRSPRDGSGRARFRFTISGRHDSHIRRSSMMTSTGGDNHLTSVDVRPEVWTLSPVNATNCVTWHHENTSTSLVQSLSSENVGNKNIDAINSSRNRTSTISDGHAVDGTTNEPQPLQVVNVATSEQPNESDVIKYDGDVSQNGTVTPPKTAPTLCGKDDKGAGDGDVLPQQLPTIRQTDRRCSKAFALVAASLSRKSAPTNQQQAKQRDRSERREMRATIRMAAIIGMFGAMWIGFFVSYVANGVTNGDIRLPPSVDAFLFWLGYVNSTVNPILYAVFNADFRRAFQRILAGCCCCQAGVRMLRPSASSRSRGAGPAGRRASSRRQRPRRPCPR